MLRALSFSTPNASRSRRTHRDKLPVSARRQNDVPKTVSSFHCLRVSWFTSLTISLPVPSIPINDLLLLPKVTICSGCYCGRYPARRRVFHGRARGALQRSQARSGNSNACVSCVVLSRRPGRGVAGARPCSAAFNRHPQMGRGAQYKVHAV